MRAFLTTILTPFFLLSTVAASSAEEPYSRPVEIRAVWMDRTSIPKTEEGIRALIRDYSRAGINIVHPEVIFNGYAAYPSAFLPQQDLWPGIDMLAILTDEAHKRGMEVHPWVWVFRAGNAKDMGGLLPTHPDWAMKNARGETLAESGSYWLNPCHRAVRRTLLNAYRELILKYPVDGIQLDYIRFPGPDWGYNDLCRIRFREEHGIDPFNIQPFTQPVLDWHLWREDLINTFVRDVSESLRSLRPGIKISAAVASFPDRARTTYLQNWQHWAANKWVDFLAPMDYTTNMQDFRSRVESSRLQIGDTALLAPGIGLLGVKGSELLLEQIDIAREAPVAGVTIFATAYLNAERLAALREGPFRNTAFNPVRDPLEGARRLTSSAQKSLQEDLAFDSLEQTRREIELARGLIGHRQYQVRDVGYVAPTPPDIFIPEEVVSTPEAAVPFVESPPTIDGSLNDATWRSAMQVSLTYTELGDPARHPAVVYLAHDAENLYVAFSFSEIKPEKIKADVTQRDGPVFYDDSLEFFLQPDPESKDYYQFAMNSIGVKFDSRRQDAGFDADWRGAARVYPEQMLWIAEVAIPFSALGASSPHAGATWRANFCRNRVAGARDKIEFSCWSPTYGSFHTPIRFGKITFSGEVK